MEGLISTLPSLRDRGRVLCPRSVVKATGVRPWHWRWPGGSHPPPTSHPHVSSRLFVGFQRFSFLSHELSFWCEVMWAAMSPARPGGFQRESFTEFLDGSVARRGHFPFRFDVCHSCVELGGARPRGVAPVCVAWFSDTEMTAWGSGGSFLRVHTPLLRADSGTEASSPRIL